MQQPELGGDVRVHHVPHGVRVRLDGKLRQQLYHRPLTMSAVTRLTHLAAVAYLGAIASIALIQAREVVPPAVVRTYAESPEGRAFYGVGAVAVERSGGGVWLVQQGSAVPIRIDRRTGKAQEIGRKGSGPNEFQAAFALVPGSGSEVGVWDSMRRLLIWTDSAARERRRWPVPSNDGGEGFSDRAGRVYLAQLKDGDLHLTTPVRLDSAKGLVDTVALPLTDNGEGILVARIEKPRGVYTQNVLHAPRVLWTVDALGRAVAAWTDSNYVVVRDRTGNRRLAMTPFREPVPERARKSAVDNAAAFETRMKGLGARVVNEVRLPEFIAQITRLVPEAYGGIAVVRHRLCSEFRAWRAPGSGAVAPAGQVYCAIVERFDSAGRALTPTTLGPQDRLVAARGDTLWALRSSTDGFQVIVELAVPKGGR